MIIYAILIFRNDKYYLVDNLYEYKIGCMKNIKNKAEDNGVIKYILICKRI